MADQEVIKHTKKLYRIWNHKEHSWWAKIKEFFIEIFIIVFAVTLSIWLHDKSEHSHQQKTVKEFLLGLRSDLENDIKELESDKEGYAESQVTFMYILKAGKTKTMQQDSLRYHQRGLFNSLQFVPNDGRYEGFKSSGSIGHIENSDLQNEIVDFYQEDIKILVLTNNYYSARKEKFFDYYLGNLKKETDSTTNAIQLLTSDMGQNYSQVLVRLEEVIDRYDSCITTAARIIKKIDAEYK